MQEEIRVLYVQPGKFPKERRIPNTLQECQKLVGGWIEQAPLDDNCCAVCNEEGKILHLPLNRPYVEGDVFAGVFFVCGLEDGEFVSLTDEQYARFEAEYHWPILFGESILGLIPLRCTPEQYAQHMGQDARRAPLNRNMTSDKHLYPMRALLPA